MFSLYKHEGLTLQPGCSLLLVVFYICEEKSVSFCSGILLWYKEHHLPLFFFILIGGGEAERKRDSSGCEHSFICGVWFPQQPGPIMSTTPGVCTVALGAGWLVPAAGKQRCKHGLGFVFTGSDCLVCLSVLAFARFAHAGEQLAHESCAFWIHAAPWAVSWFPASAEKLSTFLLCLNALYVLQEKLCVSHVASSVFFFWVYWEVMRNCGSDRLSHVRG